MPFYPRSVTNKGARPNSFSFCCLHLWTRNWVHQGIGGASCSLASTLKTSSLTWNKCSILGMKNPMKWLGDEDDLGIQMSSTCGTCSSSSKIKTDTLGKVGSKEKPKLKLCNVSHFQLHHKLCSIPEHGFQSHCGWFHNQICNLCLFRVNAHNVHHPKPPYSKY